MTLEFAQDTFNTDHNKFAAQFTQSQKNVTDYLQHTLALEGKLISETMRIRKKQIIKLTDAIDPHNLDLENKNHQGQDNRQEVPQD